MACKVTMTFIMNDVEFDADDDMIMVASDAIFENGLPYYTEDEEYEIVDVKEV